MTISYGSGQTDGAPLLLTAVTLGTAQTVHTFPAGAATPNLVSIFATNASDVGVSIILALYNSVATLVWTQTVVIGARAALQPVFDSGVTEADLIANGTCVLKAYAGTASVISVSATVDNQANTSGAGGGATVSDNFASGLVAAVQNANRFAFPAAQAGVGTATEVNANQMIARAGILRNLRAKADTTVGGGATVLQSDTDTIAVAIGDLVTFMVSCDNAGAPAANFHVACEYQAQ